MEKSTGPIAEEVPPHAQLIQMVTGFWVSRLVYAAAALDLAGHLADGPMSAAELAVPTHTHGPTLHRFMRTLASIGILTEDSSHRFSLTPLGEALKTGAPGSARATVLSFGGDRQWRSWEHLIYSLETGKTGMEKAFGVGSFDYFAQHPQEGSYFSESMVGFYGNEPPAVAAAYDFSRFQTVVDVGGGTGNLIAAVLGRHSGPRGILFDQSHTVKEAPALLEAQGIADRVLIDGGDIFEGIPRGGDAYLLSHVIHCWREDQCIMILNNCRKAMNPDGRILIVESVLPAGDTPHLGKMNDMVMLVLPGGQERTEEEYSTLLEKAGLRLTQVIPTESAASIIEAVLV